MKFFRYLALLIGLAVIPTAVIAGTGYYPAGGGGGSVTFPITAAQGGTGANNTATTGTVLRGNGTNFVTSTSTYPDTVSAYSLLYATGANTIGQLAHDSIAGRFVRSNGTGGVTYSQMALPYSTSGTGTFLRTSGANNVLESTYTLPSSAGTSGNVLTSDGTNIVSQALSGLPPTPTSTNWRTSFPISSDPNGLGNGANAITYTTTGSFNEWTTGTASGDSGFLNIVSPFFSPTTPYVSRQQNFRSYFHIKTGSSVANYGIAVGYADTTAATDIVTNGDLTPENCHAAILEFDTAEGHSGTYRTFTNNGSAAGTTTNTTGNIAISTDYFVCLDFSSGTNLVVYINGVSVGTISATLPGASNQIAPFFYVKTNTTAARTGSVSQAGNYFDAAL